jgi:hypothetical protein
MIPRHTTANENGAGYPTRETVGAALCGRPGFPRRGAPTDCKGGETRIFVGDTKMHGENPDASVDLRALRVSVVKQDLLQLQGHRPNPGESLRLRVFVVKFYGRRGVIRVSTLLCGRPPP